MRNSHVERRTKRVYSRPTSKLHGTKRLRRYYKTLAIWWNSHVWTRWAFGLLGGPNLESVLFGPDNLAWGPVFQSILGLSS